MRVLVTGASGMLGRGVATALIARGDDVTVLQRRAAGLRCREVLADVGDADAVRRAVAGQEAVVHLAAKVDVTGPWAEYARANVSGAENIVRACRVEGVARLVHVSSPAVAHSGHPIVGGPAAPADPAHARGHYARSKAAAEQAVLEADSAALAVVVIRPHLVWGPGDTQLVGRIIDRARAGRLVLIGSGAALIDTTYVDNAVDALLAALDRCGPVHGEAFVVSNGEPRTVAEVLARLCRAAGVDEPHRRLPYPLARLLGAGVEAVWAVQGRRDTPPLTRFLAEQLATAHWFDQRHTRAALGWTPRTGLDQGFARLARWYASGGPVPGAR